MIFTVLNTKQGCLKHEFPQMGCPGILITQKTCFTHSMNKNRDQWNFCLVYYGMHSVLLLILISNSIKEQLFLLFLLFFINKCLKKEDILQVVLKWYQDYFEKNFSVTFQSLNWKYFSPFFTERKGWMFYKMYINLFFFLSISIW